MARYPRSRHPIDESGRFITEDHRGVARHFGRGLFDVDRLFGYPGYSHHPWFWMMPSSGLVNINELAGGASVRLERPMMYRYPLEAVKQAFADLESFKVGRALLMIGEASV